MSYQRKEVLRSFRGGHRVERHYDNPNDIGDDNKDDDDDDDLDPEDVKRKLARASSQAKKERKKYARVRDELDQLNSKIEDFLEKTGAKDLDALQELLNKSDDDDDTGKSGEDDSNLKKELKELRSEVNQLRKKAEEGDSWKQKAEVLTAEKRLSTISARIRQIGTDSGVDPKRLGRFIKNVLIDYSEDNFTVDEETGDVEYEAKDGKYFTPEEIVEKFLETEDGKIFLPSSTTPGFGSMGGRGTNLDPKRQPKKGEIKTFEDYKRFKEDQNK